MPEHRMKRTCVLCDHQFMHFKPLNKIYLEEQQKYGCPKTVPETLNTDEYECPICYGLDRDRLCGLFLKILLRQADIRPLSMLDIAPSIPFTRFVTEKFPNIAYHSADLYMSDVTYCMDVQNMVCVQNEAYDIFLCCHVLEHVQDDIKAMREFYRILKADGVGLFLVPLDLQQKVTDEAWGLSEAENWRRFGQGDHVRKYNKQDFVNRLSSVGFCVNQAGESFFGLSAFEENALTKTSTLYVVSKKPGTLQQVVAHFQDVYFPKTMLSLPEIFYKNYEREQNILRCWIDEFRFSEGEMRLCGWAFLEGEDSGLTSTKVALVGEETVILYQPQQVVREDVESAFNDAKDGKYKRSGIVLKQAIDNMEIGEYRVVLTLQNGKFCISYDTGYTVHF